MRDELQHKIIYSVGHSNHSIEELMSLLKSFSIYVLVDVRSHPYSRHAPHFSHIALSQVIKKNGLKYLYLGKELGGRPEDEDFYDGNGYVLYSELAQSPLFLEGIERLERGVAKYRVAMLCSEENPTECHRRLLITPVLERRGIKVMHIRGDGRLQSEADLLKQEAQLALFKNPEGIPWKSTRSVLQRKQQRNFSIS